MALIDRCDRRQDVFIRRFLASASEYRPSLRKIHQLFSILSDATEMVRFRHFCSREDLRFLFTDAWESAHARYITGALLRNTRRLPRT